MRKIILTVLATSLMAASTVQVASAAERHSHKTYRDFRGAYDEVNAPSYATPGTGYGWTTGSNWRDDAKFRPAGN
jgi:hypothetical protein